jgi:hypothetical protein
VEVVKPRNISNLLEFEESNLTIKFVSWKSYMNVSHNEVNELEVRIYAGNSSKRVQVPLPVQQDKKIFISGMYSFHQYRLNN